jgi:hypothetical protein
VFPPKFLHGARRGAVFRLSRPLDLSATPAALGAGVATWGCKPEPPNILTENITDEVSDLYANPTRFFVQILP